MSFFHRTVGGATFFSGASTDVVAHEVGHGLLDAIRPDLWDAAFLEAGAFHEAFGDCMAVLTALHDRETREALLTSTPTLRKQNFVESTAENLSDAIRRLRPTHNAAEPRHAFNTFKYQIPETLPDDGGPGELINEVHSFGMLFSGCFYDLVAGLFAAGSTQTEASLLAAARTAGSLLVAAAGSAVITPRFFQSVGRAMVLADDERNGGANRLLIREAFKRHDIMLGADALLAPATVLDGAAPNARRGARLGASTRRDLTARLQLPRGARLSVGTTELSGRAFTHVVHTRRVPLGALDRRLKGVTIQAAVPVVIGDSGGRAAVMGHIPEPRSTEREVHSFVGSLVQHDQIRVRVGASCDERHPLGPPPLGRRSAHSRDAPHSARRSREAARPRALPLTQECELVCRNRNGVGWIFSRSASILRKSTRPRSEAALPYNDGGAPHGQGSW